MAGVGEVIDELSPDFCSGNSIISFRKMYDKNPIYSPRCIVAGDVGDIDVVGHSDVFKPINSATVSKIKDCALTRALSVQEAYRANVLKDGLGDWSPYLMGLSFGGVDFRVLPKYRRVEYWSNFSQGDEVLFGDEFYQFDFDPDLDKAQLDDAFAVYEKAAQDRITSWKRKKRFLIELGAVAKIKRSWIFHRDYRAFREQKASIVLSQAIVRKKIASNKLNRNLVAIKNIQTKVRAKIARDNYLLSLNAAKIQRIAKEKLDLNKIRLSIPQKVAKHGLSSVASGVGAVMILEGWLKFLNNAGVAGSGFAVTNPAQFAVFMGVMGITTINYLVNYRMYRAKIEESFVAQELVRRNQQNIDRENIDNAIAQNQAELNANNQEQMATWKKYLLKFLKLVLGVSIALYTVAFFFASFQNEFLFREFCGKFMNEALLNQQSFTQLIVANPVGAVFSIIFLIAAILAAGCQFYFAVSSLLKRSPAESLKKMKNYFKKINPLNKKVSCVKSDEDLHSDLNLILSKKTITGYELFSKDKGKQRLSLLSLEVKVYLIALFEGLPVNDLNDEQTDVFIKHKLSLYRVKSKIQSRLEMTFKLIAVGIFVLSVASLAVYFAPLVMTMLPIGIAFKCILGISWASLVLARLPICFESCFWGAQRFSAIICNFQSFRHKWQGHGKRLSKIVLLNLINAVANVALSFFAGASGALSYGFAASMFFLSLVITIKPSFEKNKVKVINGVIQKEENSKKTSKSCFSSAWQGAKDKFYSFTGRNAGERVEGGVEDGIEEAVV